MTARKPIIGGNWKMNLHRSQALELTQDLVERFNIEDPVDVVIFPAFPYLYEIGQALKGRGGGDSGGKEKSRGGIKLGSQDGYHQPNGAFTGEVSLSMLRDIAVDVVLVGHSERRHVIGESDELINQKVRASLDAGFEVILCVGEKLEQRKLNQTDAINAGQTQLGLAGVTGEQMSRVTIAYEPVWAIGTGMTATPADAQQAHHAIRQTLSAMFGEQVAAATRIQYGGSVKPGNAADLFNQEDIDGGLIGGASLKSDDFMGIINAAAMTAAAGSTGRV